MNSSYISRALCFHGQPMQKIWEDEHGAGDLQKLGLPPQPNYSIYQERQKYFTFQDRAKRLKLHQFIARKARELYDNDLVGAMSANPDQPNIAVVPPYEVFVNKNQDKTKRWHGVIEAIQPGDIVYGIIMKTRMAANVSILIKPICTGGALVRYLNDIPLKAYVQGANIGALPLDKQGNPRNYQLNDYVRCEVLEISVDADRLNLGMEGVLTKNKGESLGLVSSKDLPKYYRCCEGNDSRRDSYEESLRKSKEFLNPNYDILYEINGLNGNDTFSLMPALKYEFPAADYAKALRQTQASKWAFRAVADGIEHFKIGNHVEAFQCLNKALNIDPRNVEGLVARGALYANKGSFLKAVEDFEKALNINEYHVNARKYMGETLVALGRSYEEENRIQEAAKAYGDCLKIIPNHEQARLSLGIIQQRPGGQLYEMFNIPDSASESVKRKKKKRSNSSSSSNKTSSTEENSDSHTDSDSSASNRRQKDASMSPLSKRMALHAASLEAAEAAKASFNQPFYMATNNGSKGTAVELPKNVNEFKLDEDDTESRVRKLLQEASKHKKEKTKKSKKKKSKSSRKDGHNDDTTLNILEKLNFQEAYKVINGMNIENKLNENLQMYEKTIAEINKRKEILQQSTSSGRNNYHERSETPPPKAPSMKIDDSKCPAPPKYSPPSGTSINAGVPSKEEPPNKLSFQIRRPVRVDKFGLVRIATPLTNEQSSPTISPNRSRSRSGRHRLSPIRRSRSVDRRRRSRSRSLSYDRNRRRRSRSLSRSRSISRGRRAGGRRNTRQRNNSRRRTPSPFVARDGPERRRRSRSHRRESNWRSHSRSPNSKDIQRFGNRVWHRSEYDAPASTSAKGSKPMRHPSDARWLHDKYDDGPSIEEIDEIINQAQKERKQEIIKRDKNILKKSGAGSY